MSTPDPLMREVEEHAARHGRTVTELVAEGLRAVLASEATGGSELPVSPRRGGPSIDLMDRDEVWDHAT